ncbi:MAG: phosphatidate cytidylyltransferase [Chloroflexi bacterium]|nr:phosphatidate cytidylyltransferase [Chloroflexota bacterium]
MPWRPTLNGTGASEAWSPGDGPPVNLRIRSLSAAILLPLTMGAAWLGGSWFLAFLALAAALGAIEFYGLVSRSGGHPMALAGAAGAVLFVTRTDLQEPSLASLLLLALAAFTLLRHLQFRHREIRVLQRLNQKLTYLYLAWHNSLLDWGWTLLGMGYCGWLLSRLAALRLQPDGREWVLLALFATFALDTSSFFIGRRWGRHALAPRVSPHKTWEGAIGGLFGAVAASLALGAFFELPAGPGHLLALGVLIGVAGQIGDLAESWLKRRAGAKDSGSLIPGHGGVLDRLDSLLFASFVVYYYVVWVIL